MELINQIDQDALSQKVKNALPFPHFCIDGFLQDEFANEIYQAFPSYQDAQALGRTFSAVNEKKKIQITDADKFPEPILRLHQLLASPEVVAILEKITGIQNLLPDPDLIGGGIHETNSGGHLDVHVDFNYIPEKQWHRRVNMLIYFNKDWKEEYGGYLDIWDKEVKHCYGSFAPIFNRACGFVTSEISFHGVTPVKCPADQMRKSFAVYYYTREAPEGWDGAVHSTVFKPRPDEWLKGNLLMPIEESITGSKLVWTNIKSKVKKILKKH